MMRKIRPPRIVALTAIAFTAMTCASAVSGGARRPDGAVAVHVDETSSVHAFSPLIFGVAFGNPERNAANGYPLRRWGGNSVRRYNWQVDVNNTALDYYFENIPCSSDRTQMPPLGNAADAFIGAACDAGAQVLLTIPTIGWTPRADNPLRHPYFARFSVDEYGAQQSIDPFDPDAGNGVAANGAPIAGNDPHDTSREVDPAFQATCIRPRRHTTKPGPGRPDTAGRSRARMRQRKSPDRRTGSNDCSVVAGAQAGAAGSRSSSRHKPR